MKDKAEIREKFRQACDEIESIAARRVHRIVGRRSQYGKRGGTSANAGKKAVTYEATLPDGQVVRKKSFHVDQPEAFLGCWKHPGESYSFGGIWPTAAAVPESQGFVTAVRINGKETH